MPNLRRRIANKAAHAHNGSEIDKCYFVITKKPNAGDGMNEQGELPNVGGPNGGEPQVIVQEEVVPHPDNIQVDAYAQLLVTVQGLKEVVGE